MVVHRGRSLDVSTRNALIGAAAVGGVAALYALLKPKSPIPFTQTQGTQAPIETGPNQVASGVSGLPRRARIGLGQSGSCPDPPTADGTSFPSDDDLVAYGQCQGVALVTSSTIYQDVTAALNAGEQVAEVAAGAAATAITVSTLLGSASLAATIAVATAVAVPAIGVVAAAIVLLEEIGTVQCNINVPSSKGYPNTENIDCSWYGSQWIPNALKWVADNPTQAIGMTADQLCVQTNIYNGPDDPVWGFLYQGEAMVYPQISQYPTAYEMLKQIQLPAAASVIGAAPGLLYELTNITTINVPVNFLFTSITSSIQASPLMVQFPALLESDMFTLQNNQSAIDAYNDNYAVAKGAAAVQTSWPINAQTFQQTYGLSWADTIKILTEVAPGHFTTPTAPVPTTSSTAGQVAKGAAVVAGGLGIALVGYKIFTGYSTLQTAKSLWGDIKKGAGAVKSKFSENPLVLSGRNSATGGRRVAYRVRLGEDVVLFEGKTAVLYRHDTAIATFKPSSFQKTKIRSGRGEVLIFQDQLIGRTL